MLWKLKIHKMVDNIQVLKLYYHKYLSFTIITVVMFLLSSDDIAMAVDWYSLYLWTVYFFFCGWFNSLVLYIILRLFADLLIVYYSVDHQFAQT